MLIFRRRVCKHLLVPCSSFLLFVILCIVHLFCSTAWIKWAGLFFFVLFLLCRSLLPLKAAQQHHKHTHTHSHSPTKCEKGQDRAFERGREKKSNGIGWRDRKGKKSSLSCISLAKQITLFVLRNQTSKARIITIALYETGTHRVLPFVKKRPIEILRWMLTFLYWMCWRNEKLARKNIKEFIHNIHKQSHPANERVFVWVSEWKKKVNGTMLIAVLYISSCVQCAKLLASLILFPHHERKISTR